MKNRVTTNLYRGLLDGGDVSPMLQHRILAYGKATGSNALLAALAVLPDLAPEVDDALKDVNAAAVLAAWVSRPGRDPAALSTLALSDKRQVVRAALASFEGLDQESYRHLALNASLAVAMTLLGNPALENSNRVLAAASLGRCTPVSYRKEDEVKLALGGDPELVEAFLAEAKDITALVMALGTEDLTQAAQLRAVGLLAVLLGTEKRAQSSRLNPQGNLLKLRRALIALVGRPELTLVTAGALKSTFRADPVLEDELNAEVHMHLAAARSTPPPGSSTLARVRTARTPDEVLAAAKLAAGLRQPALVSALVGHSAMTPEAMAVLAPALDYHNKYAAASLWVRDPAVLTEILVAVPSLLNDVLLKRLADPRPVLVEVIRRVCEQGRPLPTSLLASRYLSPDVVARVPASYLAQSKLPVVLYQKAAELLEDAFGDDPVAWENFEQLAVDLSGTSLGELVEAVKALTQ